MARIVRAVLGFLLAMSATFVAAQPYDVDWHTVDGGGGQGSTGGSYDVAGTAGQPDASYDLTGGSYALAGGFWAILGSSGGGLQADLSATKDDGLTTVNAGDPIAYAITIANSGPSSVVGATVTDIVPAALTGVLWTCKGTGGTCTASGVGNIVDTVDITAGGSVTYTLTGVVDPAATGSLVNTVTVQPPGGTTDPNPANNSATDTDAIAVPTGIDGELNHGYVRQHDLAAQGGAPDVDLFRVFQQAHSSYEVLVDGTSGDIGSGSGPLVELLAFDQTTVLQTSVAAGAGGSRSLRFMNSLDVPVPDQYVRVQSAGCTSACDAQDVYRLSAFDTTAMISRFNNSGTQITVLILQNTGTDPVDLDVQFWAADGSSLGGPGPQTIAPHASYVLNTSSLVSGAGGSITIANTGARGQLAGKAVALEPATGFTFDTALTPRLR